MPQISETWEVHIGKEIYIMSDKEIRALLEAKEARFVKFRDCIINPAFISHMKLIETDAPRLSAPKRFIETDDGVWIEV